MSYIISMNKFYVSQFVTQIGYPANTYPYRNEQKLKVNFWMNNLGKNYYPINNSKGEVLSNLYV